MRQKHVAIPFRRLCACFAIALIFLFLTSNQIAHAITTDQVLVTCVNHDGNEGLQCAACWGDPQVIQTGYATACQPAATSYCASHGGIDNSPRFKGPGFDADYTCFTSPPATNGVCGFANNGTYGSAPHSAIALCSAGTPSAVNGASTGPWTWTCAGSSGSASCSANTCAPQPGVCGSDNNQNLTSTPTNLCSTGTASPVTGNGTGPWSWTCSGGVGTTPTACSTNAGGSCPGIDFAADGDVQWTFPSYCDLGIGGLRTNTFGNWNASERLLGDHVNAECNWPNWPKTGANGFPGVNGTGWSGIAFPGPPNFTNPVASAWSPSLPTQIHDAMSSPLFPFKAIRDADHAAGVADYMLYPNKPATVAYDSNYPYQWYYDGAASPQYMPDDVATTSSLVGKSSNIELGDLEMALWTAMGMPTYEYSGNYPINLSCYGAENAAGCLAGHANVPGAKGEVVSHTYPNGDTWSFQLNTDHLSPDPNGGCSYDADAPGNPGSYGFSIVDGRGGSHGYLLNYPEPTHQVGHCKVHVEFHRPAHSTACALPDPSKPQYTTTGGLPKGPYCGVITRTGVTTGEIQCDPPEFLGTPTAPNTSTAVGPQNCSQDCFQSCGRNLCR